MVFSHKRKKVRKNIQKERIERLNEDELKRGIEIVFSHTRKKERKIERSGEDV